MTNVNDTTKLETKIRTLNGIIGDIEDVAYNLAKSNRTIIYANMIMTAIHKDWQS